MTSDKFLSQDENVITKIGDVRLTDSRIVEYVENGKNKDYKDIQLDKLDSFTHYKRFNHTAAAIGALLIIGGTALLAAQSVPDYLTQGSIAAGILTLVHTFLTIEEKYKIKSSGGTKITLESSNTPKFWKKVNEQKNY